MRLTKLHISMLAIGFFLAAPAHAQMGGGMSPTPSGPNPADAAVPYNNGIAAFNAGNYEEAIRELRKARAADGSDGAIPYALGLAYSASGKKKEAKLAFQGADSGASPSFDGFFVLFAGAGDSVARAVPSSEPESSVRMLRTNGEMTTASYLSDSSVT